MNDRTEDLILKHTARACDAIFGAPRVKPDVTAADMLAFLDAHKAYIELGGSHRKAGSAYITFEGAGWKAHVCKKEGYDYHDIESEDEEDFRYPTLREAIEAVMEWRKGMGL